MADLEKWVEEKYGKNTEVLCKTIREKMTECDEGIAPDYFMVLLGITGEDADELVLILLDE